MFCFSSLLYWGGAFWVLSEQGHIREVQSPFTFLPTIAAAMITSTVYARYKMDYFLQVALFGLLGTCGLAFMLGFT